MIQYIAILRGINVGGKRKVLMAELKDLFEAMGFKEVSTYIQSGNVFFKSAETNSEEISNKLEQAVLERFGFEVPVVIRTKKEIEQTILDNPFLENSEINCLHLTFFKGEILNENLSTIESLDFSPDQFQIIGQNAFVFCAGKYHESKLSNGFFEKKLKVSATTRNWKTVQKLVELTKEN